MSGKKFIGRHEEIERINGIMSECSAFVVLYGTRRVGKTTLLKHALGMSSDKMIYFECRAGSMEKNADRFLNVLKNLGFEFNPEKLYDFELIFEYLNGFEETFNVVIDEYPYLKKSTRGNIVDSTFQNIVDGCLSNIRLFLCGSDVGMMKDLMSCDSALFGRATLTMELKQWNYKEASMCYPNLSTYDKVAFYSVFGGSPYINMTLDPEKSLKENIIRLYVREGGEARLYTSLLLMSGAPTLKDDTEPILEALGNGKRKYGELKRMAKVEFDNTFTNHLDTALKLELIRKIHPINKPDDAKKSSYEISDNVLRFYFTYIYGHLDEIEDMGPEIFYDKFISPTLVDFISRRFEDICRTFFKLKIKSGEYKEAVKVGTFYFDDSENKQNGEYDVAVKIELLKDVYCYDIYEVKYHSDPLVERTLRHETEDVLKIKGLSIRNIGFVSVNGFDNACSGLLITGDDLYV